MDLNNDLLAKSGIEDLTDFKPVFLYSGGFMQTVLGPILGMLVKSVDLHNEIMDFEDGGKICLSWYYDKNRTKGIVCILPGLTSDTKEFYVKNTINAAVENGYNAVVVNHRGCNGVKIETPKMYWAASSWDFREAVHYIHKKYPHEKLYGIGYSLGANILAKYCGEDGEKCILDGATCVSSPFDMPTASKYLESTYYGIFTRFLASNIKNKILEHKEMIPLVEQKYNICIKDILDKCKTLRDIDDKFTAKVFGYGNVENYYNSARANKVFEGIKIKVLFISALDDPVTGHECIPKEDFKKNQNIYLIATHGGGHVCHFYKLFSSKQWFTIPTFKFFDQINSSNKLD